MSSISTRYEYNSINISFLCIQVQKMICNAPRCNNPDNYLSDVTLTTDQTSSDVSVIIPETSTTHSQQSTSNSVIHKNKGMYISQINITIISLTSILKLVDFFNSYIMIYKNKNNNH